MIQVGVRKFQKGQPLELEPGVVLRQVPFLSTTIVCKAFVDEVKDATWIEHFGESLEYSDVGDALCLDFRAYFAGAVERVTYFYEFSDGGTLSRSLSREYCQHVLAQ